MVVFINFFSALQIMNDHLNAEISLGKFCIKITIILLIPLIWPLLISIYVCLTKSKSSTSSDIWAIFVD